MGLISRVSSRTYRLLQKRTRKRQFSNVIFLQMNDKEIANSSTLSIKGYSTNRIKNSSRFSPLSICKKSAEKIAGIHKPVHSSSTNSSNDPSPIKNNNNNNNNKKFSNSNNHTPRI